MSQTKYLKKALDYISGKLDIKPKKALIDDAMEKMPEFNMVKKPAPKEKPKKKKPDDKKTEAAHTDISKKLDEEKKAADELRKKNTAAPDQAKKLGYQAPDAKKLSPDMEDYLAVERLYKSKGINASSAQIEAGVKKLRQMRGIK